MNDLALKTLEPRELRLNTISLRGFYGKKLRKGSGGGSGDGFPQLPGDVTRWHFGGLTNEMMAAMDDPRIEDADHKGRFLSFKNFAWKGMSGVGGVSTYYDKYEFTPDKYYMVAVSSGTQHAQFTFKVTGLVDGNTLSLADTSSPSNVYGKWTQDGIYTVDIDVINTDRSLYFYNGVSATRGEFTIEILPLYPGFILGDGVDDFAVTEKELNFEDTYTVYTAFIPFQNNPTKNMMMAGKDIKDFYMNYSSLNALSYYSGNKSVVINLSNGFNLLCCKRDADNMTIKNLITGDSVTATANEFINNPGLYYLWRVANGYSYARLAIAGQTICNGYFSTDEDDEKVFDWYKKQYPWLFFDQAWTVTGKTNEDEDRATIANITGNGNDLVLSNFGFAEGSGYNEEGEYAGYLVTDGVDDRVQDSSFKLNKDWTLVGEWVFLNQKATNAGITKPFSFVVHNRTTGLSLFINTGTSEITIENVKSIKAICSDGRIYLDDWSEMLISKDQDITSSTSVLSIGFNGPAYTQMAFKNLGIYNNQILSKDDCIKAYNYLQTLKAK